MNKVDALLRLTGNTREFQGQFLPQIELSYVYSSPQFHIATITIYMKDLSFKWIESNVESYFAQANREHKGVSGAIFASN
jgi:hypothetical protein